MLKNNEYGFTQPLAVPFAVVTVLLIVMTGLSMWSYVQFTDQRDNVNVKVAEAVAEAEDKLENKLEKEFEEREKSPLTSYQGPAALGSITVKYPKTWSAYVDSDETNSRAGIDAYFHPRYVPELKSDTAYALRVELSGDSYSDTVEDYDDAVEDKVAKATPIKVSGVQGVRIDGEIDGDYQGALLILPLRDKTLKVYTQSTEYLNDFNKYVVKNLKFIP